MNKCLGCGVEIENSGLCERCFRIKHYNEYKMVDIKKEEYEKMLDKIEIDANVFLLVDVLNIPSDLSIFKKFKNLTMVLTKKDQLPVYIRDEKILDYFSEFNDKIIISSFKNYNLDEIYEMLEKNKKNYIVGYTNSGKSTFINKIIYNYTNLDLELTTSMMPSTTLDFLEIKLNSDIVLVDTPGLIEEGSVLSFLDKQQLKKLVIKKPINPITYQINEPQTIIIFDNICFTFSEKNSATFYISNSIDMKRIYKKIDFENTLHIEGEKDIVIPGLGFINVKRSASIKYCVPDGVKVYSRTPLI